MTCWRNGIIKFAKSQIPKFNYQTNNNNQNSKFKSAEPFDPYPFIPEHTAEKLVAGQRFWSLKIGN
jgi:hypothetical protein